MDPRYRFKTATIIELLGITEAEMRACGFRHLVSPEIRRTLRACLYMAAVAAARGSNPAIAGFYRRLRQAGKPAELALTACMRKLVVVLNAMLRINTAWKQA